MKSRAGKAAARPKGSAAAEVAERNPGAGKPDKRDPGERPNAVEPHASASLPIVGLGGSAGSISALQSFFRTMPPDSGMDHFLAVLSHELRTPLTPVLVAAQTLSLRTDLPEPVREALEAIKRNVRIEAHFIDDLLDLIRIARGQLQVLREPMDMHEAIRGALEICENDIRAKSQQLKGALNAPRTRIEGDFGRLQQVVWNVVKNASKFSPRGADVIVTTSNDGNRFRLVVADTGIGIEPERLTRVFDAFAQGSDRITREFGGLGLGLAISKATVDAHDGAMSAESAGTNRGTTITITLPLA